MVAVNASDRAMPAARDAAPSRTLGFLRRHPTVGLGLGLLSVVALLAAAPWLHTVDPITFNPVSRLKPLSERFWFGTDGFGRDVYSRTLYGGRISLLIGFSVALLSTVIGGTVASP
jgi:peptide/nickel transport system permease protein